MRHITLEDLNQLLLPYKAPCISIYQPTHREHPKSLNGPICFKNLLRNVRDSLKEKYPTSTIDAIMQKLQPIEHDEHFWNHRSEGLAILCSLEVFHIFDLQRPVPELALASDTFHIKPLLRILQSADRYQLLCLNRSEAKLYEGNRDMLSLVNLSSFATTLEDVLGTEVTEPHQTVASYGGVKMGGAGNAMHHWQGSRKDEIDLDTERFFRAIDRTIFLNFSQPSGLPLMLIALPEHHASFKQVSNNRFLMDECISADPNSLSVDQLKIKAWEKREPIYLERLAALIDSYYLAKSRKLGTDDLDEVAEATVAGRIGTLLIDADREVPGTLDTLGRIHKAGLSRPDVGDLLDDIAESVLRMKGEVIVVPSDKMPSETGIAATFRF